MTTAIGNFNVNLTQTKVFEFQDLKDGENMEESEVGFENMLERTEMRNKILKKMNNQMD